MQDAKILIYDLEVSPMLGWVYQLYDANVLRVEQESFIMCFSWRWYGEKKTHNHRIKFGKDITSSELPVVQKLWELLDEAQIVIAHNGDRFDNKVATAAFIRHGITPPSPYKSVDTLKIARSAAKFKSNSLDSLCEQFGIGNKSKIKHSDLWWDCLRDDRKAWKLMVKYNNQDVDLLYALYEKLRPYAKTHPNINIYTAKPFSCTRCGSSDLVANGKLRTPTSVYQQYRCRDCGAWVRDRVADKGIIKPQVI